MRRVLGARLGIALALGAVGAFGVTAAGCGGQSDNPIGDADAGAGSDTGTTLDSGGGGSDSGGDSTVGVQDSGGDGSVIADGGSDGNESIGDSGHEAGLDAGFDADADTGVPPLADAKLVLVHAAPGLGPVRFCLATSVGTAESVVAPISALPHGPLSAPSYPPPPAFGSEYDGGSAPVAQGTPGLYPGTIAALPDITSLDAFAITFILIDANAIANNTAAGSPDGGPELTCQQLLGTHAKGTTDSPVAGTLTPSQFIVLPAIPPGTFPDGSTSLLSFTGCVAGYEPSAAARAQGTTATDICGADFGSSGNVAVGVAPIDTTSAPTSGGWGVQFAHRSTAIQGTPVPIVAGGTPTGIVHKAASAGLLPQITASGDHSVHHGDRGPDHVGIRRAHSTGLAGRRWRRAPPVASLVSDDWRRADGRARRSPRTLARGHRGAVGLAAFDGGRRVALRLRSGQRVHARVRREHRRASAREPGRWRRREPDV